MAKKKKYKKWPFFDQNHGLTPWEKMTIFRLFKLLVFFRVERRFFVLEYRERHFPGLNYLKRKVQEMAIFRPKPWVNPFGKMPIFGFFGLFVFKA